MNIFFTYFLKLIEVNGPKFSIHFPSVARQHAANQLDKHAVKMVLETAQLLSMCLRFWMESDDITLLQKDSENGTSFCNSTTELDSVEIEKLVNSVELSKIYKNFNQYHHCTRWAKLLIPYASETDPETGVGKVEDGSTLKFSYNYNLLVMIGLEMCKEFEFRFHKKHKCANIIEYCSKFYAVSGANDSFDNKHFISQSHPITHISPPPQCLSVENKVGYGVTSIYKERTKTGKIRMCKGKPKLNHYLIERPATLQELDECQRAYRACYFYEKRAKGICVWLKSRSKPIWYIEMEENEKEAKNEE